MQQSGKSPPLCDTLRNTHFMWAFNVDCDDPWRCAAGWREFSKLNRGTFRTRGLLFTIKSALELSAVDSRQTSWHTTSLRKKWPGGQEVSASQGLFPAWWGYRHPDTLGTKTQVRPPHRKVLRSLPSCPAAKMTTPLRGFKGLLSALFATFFFFLRFPPRHHSHR